MTTVSTRELKDGLSTYLRRAEQGEHIVVMRGRKAVAALVPLEEAEGLDEDGRLAQLAARGLVVMSKNPPPGETIADPRIPARGKSAAEMVLEDRR